MTALIPIAAASSGLRYATQDEADEAYRALLNVAANHTAEWMRLAEQLQDETHRPVVVSDFSQVGQHLVVLVPPGVHHIPADLLDASRQGYGPRYFIGLAGSHCILELPAGNEQGVINADTGERTDLAVFDVSPFTFINLGLSAQKPSVLETYFDSRKLFSDVFFNVTTGDNVDILNIESFKFKVGHVWALAAYGADTYAVESPVEQLLCGAYEGGQKMIDAFFRPLLAVAGRLDNLLGLR